MYQLRILFLISLLGILIHDSIGQITFQKHYGTGSETGNKILSVNGGFLVAGSTRFPDSSDFMITRIDSTGNVLWAKSYGGIYVDEANAVDNTYDGGYILAGYTASFGGITPNDYDNVLLIKIDANGNTLWSRIIDAGGIDIAYSIQETFDHGFILTGKSTIDMLLVKTDSTGNIEWGYKYGISNFAYDEGRAVIQTRDSNFAVLGMTDKNVAPDTAIFLFIVDPAGNVLLPHFYQVMNLSVPDDVTHGYDLIQNQDGDLLIAGASGGNFQNLFHAMYPFVLKTDSMGNYLDGKIYALNTGLSKGFSICEIPGGDYIIGGTLGNYYPLMIRTDANLNKSWCFHYGNFTTIMGYGFHAIPTTDGGFALTGYRNYVNPGTYVNLIKTNSAGQSGCFQGIPMPSGGASSNFTFTHFGSTIIAGGIVQQIPVTIIESILILADSSLCNSTGIAENYSNPISISPNPTNNYLNIQLPESTNDCIIEIHDISDKMILSKIFLSSESTIDVSGFSPGIYFLIVKSPNKLSWVSKFCRH